VYQHIPKKLMLVLRGGRVEENGLRLPLTVIRFAFGESFGGYDGAGEFKGTEEFPPSSRLSCGASGLQVSGPGQSSCQQDGQARRLRLHRSTLTQALGSEQ